MQKWTLGSPLVNTNDYYTSSCFTQQIKKKNGKAENFSQFQGFLYNQECCFYSLLTLRFINITRLPQSLARDMKQHSLCVCFPETTQIYGDNRVYSTAFLAVFVRKTTIIRHEIIKDPTKTFVVFSESFPHVCDCN